MTVLAYTLRILAALTLAPIAGGLLTGLDRKLSARLQGRVGPPLLQPFYDVGKLVRKQSTTVNSITRYYITFSLFFNAFTVVMFFLGMDLLLCIFAFTLACVFFVIAGYSSFSPYSFVGTERELVQIVCYEPMILIMAFSYYSVTRTFAIHDVLKLESPLIFKLPLIFVGITYVLTIKLRKSPFDLSMSHHGHQEIVKGITTELTGICMAMIEIAHWFETIFALGLVMLFFVYSNPASWIVGGAACLIIYFFEVVIDNSFARIKWRNALTVSWIVTIVTGTLNFLLINMR